MAQVEHTSDARVLVGIRCPAAFACMRERGHFQIPARGSDRRSRLRSESKAYDRCIVARTARHLIAL